MSQHTVQHDSWEERGVAYQEHTHGKRMRGNTFLACLAPFLSIYYTEDNVSQQEYTWSVWLLCPCKPGIISSLTGFLWFCGATTQSHIPFLWMVHAGCVFVAGIHPPRTWTSGSVETVRWNACVHRLDLGLYSHPKELFCFLCVFCCCCWGFFLGGGGWEDAVKTHVNSMGNILSTWGSIRIEPVTLHHTGQRAQHTTDWAIPAPRDCFDMHHLHGGTINKILQKRES